MAVNLARDWAKHIRDPKRKLEFETSVLHSGIALDRLEELLDGYIEELRRAEFTDDYTSPAWPFLQADRLGQLKSLVKIRRLLDRKTKVSNE